MADFNLLKTAEVKKLLNVSNKTLKKWRNDGTLSAAVNVGKVIRYNADTVNQFVSNPKKQN